MKEVSERRVGALKVLALALTLIHDGIHGYELCRKISELSGGKWVPSMGTIYRILNELAKEGYLIRNEEGRGERQLVTYRITDKGIEFLAKNIPNILRKNYLGMKIILGAYIKMMRRNSDKVIMENEVINYLKEIEELIHELEEIRDGLKT